MPEAQLNGRGRLAAGVTTIPTINRGLSGRKHHIGFGSKLQAPVGGDLGLTVGTAGVNKGE